MLYRVTERETGTKEVERDREREEEGEEIGKWRRVRRIYTVSRGRRGETRSGVSAIFRPRPLGHWVKSTVISGVGDRRRERW